MLENRSHLLIYLSNQKLELESYKNEADFLQKKTVILEISKLVRPSTNRSKTLTVTTPVKQKRTSDEIMFTKVVSVLVHGKLIIITYHGA